jgi:hypothetical protein
LSHLLSGRNKPSLDFILKIVDVFPDVDLYWILNGGVFLKIKGGAKTRKQTRKRNQTNSVLKKASLHFLKIYFQKKLHGEGK